MAIQTINIGTTANDGTGDDPRTAGGKINDNFTNSTHAASRDVGTASGDVMEVGAFGLGSIPGEATDLSSLPSVSSRYIVFSEWAGSVYNGASGLNSGSLDVRSSASNDLWAFYTHTAINSDDVHMRRKSNGTLQSWFKLITTSNTTVDGSGFIKEASPIVKLFSDKIELNDYKEIENCTFERIDTGHYIIKGAPLLSRDGWYIETLKDRNNNIYFTLDYEELEDGLHIKTYEPDYSTGRATNGAPVDINEGRFVTLRFEEDKTEE